ncbi:hypothetical protein NLI96_g3320 [Meripilus lineatus]|uniref:DUF6533 domain-containing protein n=1 Tax=Meripilus lineatus TaxID=2056292 RepID=A0AAD5VCG3_9APHY|nr:hypothetical protein NLI96_g3320 [Physisporinus lineatus]
MVLANSAAYLRVGSLAVATYDYFLTLPAEWRFYTTQQGGKLGNGCILFILIRYLSIVTLTLSNVGYFGSFTNAVCQRYYLAAPIFKVLQTMVSHIILGLRAYAISRRRLSVKWFLIALFIIINSAEWFTNLWNRSHAQHAGFSNCTPGNDPNRLSAWLFYVFVMTYDLVTLILSIYYLVPWRDSIHMSSIIRMMLVDGLGYFLVLTGEIHATRAGRQMSTTFIAANIFNLVLYRTTNPEAQSSGYAVTWIMSQRIVIHLRDTAVGRVRSGDHVHFTSCELPQEPYSPNAQSKSPFGKFKLFREIRATEVADTLVFRVETGSPTGSVTEANNANGKHTGHGRDKLPV